MQMVEPGLSVDVMGISARRGDTGIDGLPALSHHHQIIDAAFAQRPEKVLPRLRQEAVGAAEGRRYRLSRQAVSGAAIGRLRLTIRPRARAISHACHLLSQPLAAWHDISWEYGRKPRCKNPP